jgi:hypothetical protein
MVRSGVWPSVLAVAHLPCPARAATAAFRAAAATIEASETRADVQRAITQFVEVINGMPNTHTVKREDVAEALCQLAGKSLLEVPDEVALMWFDAARDF